jgi:hypothetical protein
MNTANKRDRGNGSIGPAHDRRRAISLGSFAAIVSLVACPHLAVWTLKTPDTTTPSIEGRLPSVSYIRFVEPTPDGLRIPEARIRADLTEIAKRAKPVRTYASAQGLERGARMLAASATMLPALPQLGDLIDDSPQA